MTGDNSRRFLQIPRSGTGDHSCPNARGAPSNGVGNGNQNDTRGDRFADKFDVSEFLSKKIGGISSLLRPPRDDSKRRDSRKEGQGQTSAVSDGKAGPLSSRPTIFVDFDMTITTIHLFQLLARNGARNADESLSLLSRVSDERLVKWVEFPTETASGHNDEFSFDDDIIAYGSRLLMLKGEFNRLSRFADLVVLSRNYEDVIEHVLKRLKLRHLFKSIIGSEKLLNYYDSSKGVAMEKIVTRLNRSKARAVLIDDSPQELMDAKGRKMKIIPVRVEDFYGGVTQAQLQRLRKWLLDEN